MNKEIQDQDEAAALRAQLATANAANAEAFRRGAEAMRAAILPFVGAIDIEDPWGIIRALPIPDDGK